MKLVIATPHYPPEPGGPSTYTKILEEGLAKFGVEVAVVAFASVRGYPFFLRHGMYFLKVRSALRTADIVLALDPVSTGLPAALAAIMSGKPLVLKVVGDYAWEQGTQRFGITTSLDDFARTGRVPFPVAVFRCIEMWVAHRARIVIVPSEYLKRIVVAWGIAKERIEVIPNAVALTRGGTVSKELAELPHPRVISVARLVPWKGIDTLIEAVARVRATYSGLSLIIVGDGPKRRRFETLAKEKLANGYVFTGALPPDSVHAALLASDIFVLNSSYEGLSHVLIEALMSGLPIVATKAGGNEEVLREGSGILIPVGDTGALAAALGDLTRDSGLRERLATGARDRAKAFSVDSMLARTNDLLSTPV